VVVGEQNQQNNPATATYAAQYKKSHGYPEAVHVVADPGWMKISQAINHGSGSIALPYIAVLDGNMTLKYLGDGGQTSAFEAITPHLETLTGVAYSTPSGGCTGFCEGQSASGCWCDDLCSQYNDCCSDRCDVCGICN
jgi:hypothetical protein